MRLDQVIQRVRKWNATEKSALLVVLLKDLHMHADFDRKEKPADKK